MHGTYRQELCVLQDRRQNLDQALLGELAAGNGAGGSPTRCSGGSGGSARRGGWCGGSSSGGGGCRRIGGSALNE